MKRTIAVTAVMALLSSGFLFAVPAYSEDMEYARPGLYVGASAIGGSSVRLDSLYRGVAFDPEILVAPGAEFYFGYRADPAVAFEVEADYLPASKIDLDGLDGATELETWTITVNSKFFFMHQRIQPYGLVGLGVMHIAFEDQEGFEFDGNEFGVIFKFGAGIDYYITRNLVASIGADYVLPAAESLEDLDLVTFGLGAQIRF
ncbi:MAG: outer membrane beta-barrel protein [Myxococcota bacterium]